MNKHKFKVEKRKVFVEGSKIPIKGLSAIYRPDTDTSFKIVSDKYKIITHEEISNTFDEAFKTLGGVFSDFSVTTKLPKQGALMLRKYTFPKITIEMGKWDNVNLVIEVFNSYNGTKKVGYFLGGFRQVCTNGLMVSEKYQEVMKKHFDSIELETIIDDLVNAIEVFKKTGNIWDEWRKEPITVVQASNWLDKFRYASQKDKVYIIDRFDRKEEKNRWGLFQAITYFITHNVKSKESDDNRLKQVAYETNFAKALYKKGNLI